MNQRQIGGILLILGIILSIVVLFTKNREDSLIDEYIDEKGTCYLTDGSCLHGDRDYTVYIVGWVIAASLIILGIYLIAFDKTQRLLAQQSENVSSALRVVKQKDEFLAFLSGFTEDEQKVLRLIKSQEGIKQETLRIKAGMSKTSLSLMLKELEERDIIAKKPSGKTNQVFLKKEF
ncbi:MarR family transcriptional regulator [Candidatus Woesearchaeota archaeon]|nr:MAG: MarR family transcriptional regulator [archaeon GW2011_AR4]MBS3129039.1 MarR family transcriptional regulator [Candidatus Woesearchaeota archaeon]HIH37773.1 MarR family transcriptional regulator [Candidatus Woesearchaeota archaeon]HIH49544.1 MarR family transcriptional regulator [Candidatus Woesearchaeota archaeon]HIJ03898.1 MarR family transcriptional regulator [Candidatus Woesearchaeota archaeon]